MRQVDNLLKPDLVAPGNRIVGAGATQALPYAPTWNKIASDNPDLVAAAGGTQFYGQTLMMLSATSVPAPAVSGTVALMLQANPGLTPPLIKAMLQYGAQPIEGASRMQQAAGMLNVPGAVALARAARSDVETPIQYGTIVPGDPMLRVPALPTEASTVEGQSFNWSRIVFVGGNRILSGGALFSSFQPIWDPRLTWASGVVTRRQALYWPATMWTPGTMFVKSFSEAAVTDQALPTPSVVRLDPLAGRTSRHGHTGGCI